MILRVDALSVLAQVCSLPVFKTSALIGSTRMAYTPVFGIWLNSILGERLSISIISRKFLRMVQSMLESLTSTKYPM